MNAKAIKIGLAVLFLIVAAVLLFRFAGGGGGQTVEIDGQRVDLPPPPR